MNKDTLRDFRGELRLLRGGIQEEKEGGCPSQHSAQASRPTDELFP